MKKAILILGIVFLMSCTTLRYGDDLKEPYSQTEMEISGAGTIIITILGVLTGSVIYNGINDF